MKVYVGLRLSDPRWRRWFFADLVEVYGQKAIFFPWLKNKREGINLTDQDVALNPEEVIIHG